MWSTPWRLSASGPDVSTVSLTMSETPRPRTSSITRLAAGSSPDSNSLVLDFAPFDPDSDRFELPNNSGRELLAKGLRVSFDYFGAQQELDPPDWHDEWLPDSARLPTIVRVHLTTAGQQWPELLFRIRFEEME